MPFEATVYRVLIASPGDVPDERLAVEAAIRRWNSDNSAHEKIVLMPQRWEVDTVPDYGAEPQALTNEQVVDQSDILLCIFWWKLGTPTAKYPSGTVEEINRFVDAGKPVIIYTCDRPLPQNIIKVKANLDQFQALQALIELVRKNALTKPFTYKDQLGELVYSALAFHLRNVHKPKITGQVSVDPSHNVIVEGGSTNIANAVSKDNRIVKNSVNISISSGPFFSGRVHSMLSAAIEEATVIDAPIFGVVFNPFHPSNSRLQHTLGNFLEYETTRHEINSRFVQALLPADEEWVKVLIPLDDPLESSRIVIMLPDGSPILSESAYANPDEGLQRSRQYFKAFLEHKLTDDEKRVLAQHLEGPSIPVQRQSFYTQEPLEHHYLMRRAYVQRIPIGRRSNGNRYGATSAGSDWIRQLAEQKILPLSSPH